MKLKERKALRHFPSLGCKSGKLNGKDMPVFKRPYSTMAAMAARRAKALTPCLERLLAAEMGQMGPGQLLPLVAALVLALVLLRLLGTGGWGTAVLAS